MYLYTDQAGLKKEIKYFQSSSTQYSGEQALDYRKVLEKKQKTPIVAWCLMGGDNPSPSF
jgi:hypothetical protein